ncbi:MAG TPA: hypothetical protein VGL09_14265 [Methylomirabilota bacterium]
MIGNLDGPRLEALLLEIRRLGARHGFTVMAMEREVVTRPGRTPRRR